MMQTKDAIFEWIEENPKTFHENEKKKKVLLALLILKILFYL